MTENRIEQIDRYLAGQLPEAERTALEAELKANPALAAQVAQQRLHLRALETLLHDDLSHKLKTWETASPADPAEVRRHLDLLEKEKNGNRKATVKWVAFSLVAALALLGGIYFFSQKTASPDAPAPELKELPSAPQAAMPVPDKPEGTEVVPSEKIPTAPGQTKRLLAMAETYRPELWADLLSLQNHLQRGDEAPTELLAAFDKIREKKYSEATSLLRKIPAADPAWSDAQFLLASCHYLSGEYGKAASVFEKLSAEDGYLRSERATWWLALALLGEGQVQKSLAVLNRIAAETGHEFQEKAAALKKWMALSN